MPWEWNAVSEKERQVYNYGVQFSTKKHRPILRGGVDVISNNSDIGYLFVHTQAS